MWAGGAIEQAGIALESEPGDPAVRALPRNSELFGDVSDRSAVVDHAGDKQTTAVQIQTSISVGHEDLLVGEDVRHLH